MCKKIWSLLQNLRCKVLYLWIGIFLLHRHREIDKNRKPWLSLMWWARLGRGGECEQSGTRATSSICIRDSLISCNDCILTCHFRDQEIGGYHCWPQYLHPDLIVYEGSLIVTRVWSLEDHGWQGPSCVYINFYSLLNIGRCRPIRPSMYGSFRSWLFSMFLTLLFRDELFLGARRRSSIRRNSREWWCDYRKNVSSQVVSLPQSIEHNPFEFN